MMISLQPLKDNLNPTGAGHTQGGRRRLIGFIKEPAKLAAAAYNLVATTRIQWEPGL